MDRDDLWFTVQIQGMEKMECLRNPIVISGSILCKFSMV